MEQEGSLNKTSKRSAAPIFFRMLVLFVVVTGGTLSTTPLWVREIIWITIFASLGVIILGGCCIQTWNSNAYLGYQPAGFAISIMFVAMIFIIGLSIFGAAIPEFATEDSYNHIKHGKWIMIALGATLMISSIIMTIRSVWPLFKIYSRIT